MSISLEDAEKYELLDFEILQSIPKKCKCEAKLQLDDSLQNVICSDIKCKNNIASRLYSLVKDSGQQLWTLDDCINIANQLDIKTPYNIYTLPRYVDKQNLGIKNLGAKLIDVCDPTHSIPVSDVAENIKVLTNQKVRKISLQDMVELSGYSEIKAVAKDLFRGFQSINEAYVYIKLWPVTFVAERLGLKTDEELKIAAEIYDKLLKIEGELKFGSRYFTIIDKAKYRISVQTSGQLKDYVNVTEFIDNIEHRYSGLVQINLVPQVFQNLDVYLQDFDQFSQKFKMASDINEQYQLAKLVRHEIDREDIGSKGESGGFHLVGEKIFIGNSDELIKRLDELLEKEVNN